MSAAAPRARPSATVLGLAPLVALLVVWQIAGSAASPFFPAPSTWLGGLDELWRHGSLLPAIVATLRTLTAGLVIATVLGGAVGMLIGASRTADRALGPTFEFARAIPPAALVPVAALLLGFDETMKVTVVTLAAFWAVLLNTRSAVHGLDPILLDSARTLRLGRLDRVRKVVLPALLPSVFVGVRVAAPIAVVITLLVEILTQVNGIGGLIAESQRTFRPARVYGLIVVAGLISLFVNGIIGAIEDRLFHHRPPTWTTASATTTDRT